MNRRTFLSRIVCAVAGLWPLSLLQLNKPKDGPQERAFHFKLCLHDMFPIHSKNGVWTAEDRAIRRRHLTQCNAAMVLICDLLNDGFKTAGQPIEVRWINEFDMNENPLGEVGELYCRVTSPDLATAHRLKDWTDDPTNPKWWPNRIAQMLAIREEGIRTQRWKETV